MVNFYPCSDAWIKVHSGEMQLSSRHPRSRSSSTIDEGLPFNVILKQGIEE